MTVLNFFVTRCPRRDSVSGEAKNVLDALENDTHTKKIARKRLWQSTISEKKGGARKGQKYDI